MIKASTFTIHLSSETIALIDPVPTLSSAIARNLATIASDLTPTITTLSLPHNPALLDRRVSILLDAATHEILLRATLSNPSLTLSSAVDGLLYGRATFSGEYSTEKLACLSPVFTMIRASSLIMVKTGLKPLPYGCLVPQHRKSEIYWVWRYPDRHGKPKDKYLGKGLDRAIAKVRAIGIPADAKPQRLNKGRKLWAA